MNEFPDSAWPSSLPVSESELLDSSWSGLTSPTQEVKGDRAVIASTWPLRPIPGLVLCEVISLPSGERTTCGRPIPAKTVGVALDVILEPFGITAGDLNWKKLDEPPRPEEPPQPRPANVYFIQAVTGGLVKIGVTQHAVHRRLTALQSGSPVQLRVVKTISNVPRTRETEIHKHFGAYRVRGEWFDPIVLTLDLPA